MSKSANRVSFIIGDSWKATNLLIQSGARPPVIKIHNNLDQARTIHNHLGDDTIIILRMIGAENIINRGKAPAVCAVEWCTAMLPAFQACPWAYFEVGGPLAPVDEWQRDYWLAAMNWMKARGYLGVVMTHGEGNPQVPSGGGDGWAVMWPVVQLAASYGYLLGPQAYWVDGNMDPADDWHMFRIYRAFRDYPGKWPAGTRIVFTESFIDLRNGLGWRTALGGDWSRARAGMKLLSEEIKRRPCPPGVEVIGATNFAIHEIPDMWGDFNYLEHLPDQLADIKAEQDSIVEVPPPPETPPETTTFAVTTTWSGGQNVRAKPSLKGGVVGGINYGQTAYIAREDAVSVGIEDSWVNVTVNNTTGWAASWLLKAA
jgi:hypothetical protein